MESNGRGNLFIIRAYEFLGVGGCFAIQIPDIERSCPKSLI